MAKSQPPLIGNWYYDAEEDQYFEIVAMDTDRGTIEIQYIDGEVGELDKEQWQQIHPNNVAPPKDADAAFELSDEHHYDSMPCPDSWNNPLQSIEPESFAGFDDF